MIITGGPSWVTEAVDIFPGIHQRGSREIFTVEISLRSQAVPKNMKL